MEAKRKRETNLQTRLTDYRTQRDLESAEPASAQLTLSTAQIEQVIAEWAAAVAGFAQGPVTHRAVWGWSSGDQGPVLLRMDLSEAPNVASMDRARESKRS